MELVRMTVLVVAGSTAAALGIAGGIPPGLVSWAVTNLGPVMEAAMRNVKAQILMQVQLSP
jgi:hypothetical protein